MPDDVCATAYVGNESNADVYFDDVRIEHRQGLQVQENQYDPFGLDLAGVSSSAPGLSLKNFYQFNGKENQLDLGLNWNHQDWRFFDYQLGRWHVVDPDIENSQESWTPYSFGFDNAVRYNDVDGRAPDDIHIRIGSQAIGVAEIRIIGSENHPGAPTKMLVPTYQMTVTDDATNKTSTYEVTRDAPVMSESGSKKGGTTVNNTAFEPVAKTGSYKGVVDKDYPKGTGLMAIAFRDNSGGRSLAAVPMPGAFRKNPHVAKGVSIHVGGTYKNPKSKTGYSRTGSEGCFTCKGGDKTNAALSSDVSERMAANKAAGTGTNIDVQVEKRKDVQKTL